MEWKFNANSATFPTATWNGHEIEVKGEFGGFTYQYHTLAHNI